MRKNLSLGLLMILLAFTHFGCNNAIPSGSINTWFSGTALPLTDNTWVQGSLVDKNEQWFSFTATGLKQYIHVNFTGLASVMIQLYTESGVAIGNAQDLYSGTGLSRPESAASLSMGLQVGQKYYICVRPTSNNTQIDDVAYRIAVTKTSESPQLITLPTSGIIPLMKNSWADGELGKSWYSFTATDNILYIHMLRGTGSAFWVEVYGPNGGTIGKFNYSSGTTATGPWELEIGKTYYIGFTYRGYSGTFQIAYSDSTIQPRIVLPSSGIISLSANTWENGSMQTCNGEWYSFTANATNQYIHLNCIRATGASVKMYDSSGNLVGLPISVLDEEPVFSRTLTNGAVYYLNISYGMASGNFQVSFNSSEVPPAIVLPTDAIPELSENIWSDSPGSYYSKRWIRFTASANTQYIHIGNLSSGYYSVVRVYDNNGNIIVTPTRIVGSNISIAGSLIPGQVYYIKIDDVYGLTYKVSFNKSETAP